MVKVSSSDLIAILRRFELANDDNVPRHIEQVKFSNPGPTNTLVSFRFNKQQFYVLFDDTAGDDTDYVLKQIRTDKQDVAGDVLENPNDHVTTYALPFKGKDLYLFAVSSGKKRLDTMLAERYPETSRSTWQKHIKAGHISVNGEVQLSPKQDLTEADGIAINTPDAADFSMQELPILYIDDNVIVINKPVGVLTHAKGALNDEFTVGEFFRRYTTYGLETNRPGIVHRLDRDTSGVMIGARNPETATLLQKQFADRKTKKTYIAIVVGQLKEGTAKIDLPIGRNPSAPSTFRVDAKGKSAVTNYTTLDADDDYSLVELKPITGRTHQLRVHMAYIGTPILGDRVYGKLADRLYLHAYQLEVTIPSGDRRIFTAPVPDDFIAKFPKASM
jgi:23S rRNA pseudouridine1911/1915/1917 synthase